MLSSSNTFTSLVMDAPGVDPKSTVIPILLSWDALVAAAREAVPDPPPRVDEFTVCPDLVPDDGGSERCAPSYCFFLSNVLGTDSRPCSPDSPLYSLQIYAYPFLQHVHISYGSPSSPTTFAQSPGPSAAHVLIDAPCSAGGKPVKEKGGGYSCPTCHKGFRRRDDAKRHMDSAGMQVSCRYCGKPSSGRRDGQSRHLDGNKNCLEAWKAGYEAGRFIKRTVEDAFN